ncbi:MAG: NAD(P)/FAD-dependent oxidoreductase [Cyanobacteria bacterium]|nr:NAD(P)/FAD-dependent oxidoreductase [Cyanobacteria bacterium CG_2015-16_32_12]NCO78486.1 NAD(P)/FAD-dependent oxidoreductase [Cyanobacteria bacterium CG_2015-22_32_23]NCQ03509.1 NAD(P)/FAD-dependent oxidoreductase [Cyanobacteria bacterium CG_2015-09_32_10]NCQ40630.1 NAD(P)/FAD-dependent oxidoreductase [Cyanobacteria bacterium CG_2015-04_32_10]NCS83559.1 NAD(P)/FAD-dependent oxidoreductase [Cyanobacteria bacterium CG_2015-02_32_10]
MTNYSDVIIVGGGAAGFFGGINCAINNPTLKITILEATNQLLGKVKISGGGRCNVTHHCFNPSELVNNYPRGGKELRGAFSRFQPQDTIKWFESRGVKLKIEGDGRIFPVTNDSQTIIDCLIKTAQQWGIKILTQTPVKEIHQSELGFNLTLKSGNVLSCKSLLIATGSNVLGYKWAKNLGHSIQSPIPSLFTFKIKDIRLENLAGISVNNGYLQLGIKQGKKLEQKGALLVTHWGLSGPAVLKLSAWGARILYDNNYNLPLIINWLPEYDFNSIKEELSKVKESVSKQKVINYSQFNIPKRLWQNLVNYSLINADKIWAEMTKKEMEKLAIELTKGEYKIEGKGMFKDEFVTCGGITLKEVDFKTMMSKICPNLYFAGEILDIDGVTGGFNFQNAWTTGYLAGIAINN